MPLEADVVLGCEVLRGRFALPTFSSVSNHPKENAMNGHPEMTALLKTFPLLEDKLDYWPEDVVADSVVRDAYCGASSGEKRMIEFLLSVWDPGTDWAKLGFANFNLAQAIGVLGGSGANVRAITAWIERPYWP